MNIVPKRHHVSSQKFYQSDICILACFWFNFEEYIYYSQNSTAYFVRISVRRIEIFYDMSNVLRWAIIKSEVKTYYTFFVALIMLFYYCAAFRIIRGYIFINQWDRSTADWITVSVIIWHSDFLYFNLLVRSPHKSTVDNKLSKLKNSQFSHSGPCMRVRTAHSW